MISHVKILILTHIVEIRRLKVKYIVNLWIKDTSIQGTKCRVPLCPLKRGSTVIIIIIIIIILIIYSNNNNKNNNNNNNNNSNNNNNNNNNNNTNNNNSNNNHLASPS